jgi:hypothetical protein
MNQKRMSLDGLIMCDLPEDNFGWTKDYEHILNSILSNSSLMSDHHRTSHIHLDRRLKYYKLPIIILSGINSIFSIGLSNYVPQESVSVINCLISLIISIIGSIELYLQINKNSDLEAKSYKDFYNLALRINTLLKLSPEHRQEDPKIFVNEMITQYENLFNESRVNGLEDLDKLVPLNKSIPILNTPKLISLPSSPSQRNFNEFKSDV